MMNWPAWLPLRADLAPLSPYGAPQVPADASMNTNENPYPPSPELQASIAQAVAKVALTLNRYPDRDATQLRTALASYINEASSTQSYSLKYLKMSVHLRPLPRIERPSQLDLLHQSDL